MSLVSHSQQRHIIPTLQTRLQLHVHRSCRTVKEDKFTNLNEFVNGAVLRHSAALSTPVVYLGKSSENAIWPAIPSKFVTCTRNFGQDLRLQHVMCRWHDWQLILGQMAASVHVVLHLSSSDWVCPDFSIPRRGSPTTSSLLDWTNTNMQDSDTLELMSHIRVDSLVCLMRSPLLIGETKRCTNS